MVKGRGRWPLSTRPTLLPSCPFADIARECPIFALLVGSGKRKGTPVGVVYRAQGPARRWQLGGPASELAYEVFLDWCPQP